MVINTAFNLLESFIIDRSNHFVCRSSFQVLTEVWMKVLSLEWILETGTENA